LIFVGQDGGITAAETAGASTMALEAQASEAHEQDRGEQSQLELSRPQSARAPSRPAAGHGETPPAARKHRVRARAPVPQERTPSERRIVEVPPQREDRHPEQDREGGNQPRRGLLRRHPFASAIGLVLLLLASACGYLYFDHAQHFQSTDDAFIAARQFAIAPKVSGYITAVPVTDNQHVEAGDVIARIDDRDYRITLDQAQAQVGVDQANILKGRRLQDSLETHAPKSASAGR
jgi:membrane fusion protein (multidrug efflux system)